MNEPNNKGSTVTGTILSKSFTPISNEGQLDLTETLMKHQNEHLTYSVCKRQLGELYDFQDSFQKLQTVERVDHE